MQRPFRFGIVCEEMTDRDAWIAKARRVEELGYATLLLRDHFVAGPFGDQLAPIAGLMAAAMVTNTLRIGSMVFDAEQVAQKRGWSGASVEEILEMPTIFIGTVEQMLERREKFGISYYMFADQIMEIAAPLIKYVR